MNAPKRDYSETLFLPQTDFPMRAGLPQREPEILKAWEAGDLYAQLRQAAKGKEKFILHDGPPYANGNIHIGHALNKILKDVVTRSQQMLGYDSNYVPGWDCHGLPIEWKIEEENYRAKGKPKPDFSNAAALVEFRQECRAFAEKWIGVQREEFKRLGVEGDWAHPYTTMDNFAEAQIARELMKFAANGTLYRGSKPVMWSVVEKTALAEAEVEYEDYTSDQVWVKFPVTKSHFKTVIQIASIVVKDMALLSASHYHLDDDAVDAPWESSDLHTRPKSNMRFSSVRTAPAENWAKPGDRYVLAENLAAEVFKQARVDNVSEARLPTLSNDVLATLECDHPLRALGGYDFTVPLLAGDHVTEDTGTGFVHTAPGHGREDFDVWTANAQILRSARHQSGYPLHCRRERRLHRAAPGFTGKRVINDKGEKGDANEAVIKALDRRAYADRARPPQAPISALLALEEADHLPQHAAVVHRDGQGDREPSSGHSGTRRRREPGIQKHGRRIWIPGPRAYARVPE